MSDRVRVHVDEKMFNAARIIRVIGTQNQKGFSTAEQPHRRSRLAAVPEPLVPLTREQLAALAALAPQTKQRAGQKTWTAPQGNGHAGEARHRLKVPEWLRDRGVGFREDGTTADGRAKFVLDHCPFNSSHAAKDACVMQAPDG